LPCTKIMIENNQATKTNIAIPVTIVTYVPQTKEEEEKVKYLNNLNNHMSKMIDDFDLGLKLSGRPLFIKFKNYEIPLKSTIADSVIIEQLVYEQDKYTLEYHANDLETTD